MLVVHGRMKRALLVVALCASVVAAARYGFYVLLERTVPAPASPVRIDVTVGEPFRITAAKLEGAGLVPSARALTLWARLKGLDRQVQHGAYEFKDAASPIALLEKMRSGEAMIIHVTLPEGATAKDLATALAHEGLGAAEAYLALVHDASFARSLGVDAGALEGYLFPDTYFFSPLDTPRKIIAEFVARFHQVFTADMATEAQKAGFSVHQIVTLASVIEKETAREEERPLVSAVFRNRLRLGMPLQADPTVIYGIENFNGNLTRRDLETRTPYNTYTEPGLPPGPIANPGRSALSAALRPAAVSYLYFVARDDGTHEFNTSLAEHNKAVNRFQRSRPRRLSTG